MHRSTLGAFVSALVIISPALAKADEQQQQEVVVRVNDLDTASDRGASRALMRIRRAAEDVCDAAPGVRPFEERIAIRECVSEAMSRAVADLGDPTVAAKFNGHSVYARGAERS